MAHFIVRIELHSATFEDYENLHGFMASADFNRNIQSDEGKRYKLPTAEYHRASTDTTIAIFNAAKNAAAKTRKKFWILLSEAQRLLWELEDA